VRETLFNWLGHASFDGWTLSRSVRRQRHRSALKQRPRGGGAEVVMVEQRHARPWRQLRENALKLFRPATASGSSRLDADAAT
jgi:hypothetical protein